MLGVAYCMVCERWDGKMEMGNEIGDVVIFFNRAAESDGEENWQRELTPAQISLTRAPMQVSTVALASLRATGLEYGLAT